jgi:hypothetical protein
MKNIKFVSLSEPLFLGGKNHALKIFNKDGTVIEYDEAKDHVKITYNGETATIKHYSTIVCSVNESREQQAVAARSNGKVKAQVSSPTDHVFAEGPGKTRQ